jgi:hypothetical protein
MERAPDHHDAELVLRLYDLRRETVIRENRARLIRDLWPRRAEDLLDVLKSEHPLNTAYRQVTTYWEMAYSFARHGALHADVLLDSAGEGLFVYARIEPFLAELRTATNPRTLSNTEWVATQTEKGRAIMETSRARVKKMLEAKAK